MDYVEELAWNLFKNTGEIKYYSLYKNLEADRELEAEEVKERQEEEMDL